MNQAQNVVVQWKKIIDEFLGGGKMSTLRKCWEKCLGGQNIYTKNK